MSMEHVARLHPFVDLVVVLQVKFALVEYV